MRTVWVSQLIISICMGHKGSARGIELGRRGILRGRPFDPFTRHDRRNERRKTGKTQWQPKLNELVLVKCQPVADTVQGLTS
jgi:hypothetical protein